MGREHCEHLLIAYSDVLILHVRRIGPLSDSSRGRRDLEMTSELSALISKYDS